VIKNPHKCTFRFTSNPWPVVFALALLAVSCGRGGAKRPRQDREDEKAGVEAAADSTSSDSTAVTHAELRGLALRLMKDVVMDVAYLSGSATPLRKGEPVILDEPASYKMHIDRAESRIGYDDLANLMNDHVFAYKGAPIKNMKAEREHDQNEEVRLELKGNLASMAGIPFEVEGVPEVTDDGRIRIRTRSIQTIGIKLGGVMDLLGIEADDVLNFEKAHGIRVDDNDMILDPSRLLPPPQASGRVTYVSLEPDGMLMRFGPAPGKSDADSSSEHYLFYRGGTIRLGRMTMTNADLKIFDAKPSDPFDFFPGDMNRQISAGYVKVQLHGGLVIIAPDYSRIDEADLRPPTTHEQVESASSSRSSAR
jgi:hypothetical protein